MTRPVSESVVKKAALVWSEGLGYAILSRKVPSREHMRTGENQLKYIT